MRHPARTPVLQSVADLARALAAAVLPGRICAMAFIPAAGSHDVHWIGPGSLPPKMPEQARQEREDRAHARIVIVLTLACTLLSIYDLVLLASGN
jgi:hypothetical protein